jgi:hypothetical protein
VWGAPRHIVAPVQEIGRHRPQGFFDCIVLNGVFGFGTDEAAAMRAVVDAVEQVLAPGGLLVVGWNTDQHEDPEALGVFEASFVPCRTTPWPHRLRFSGETHVYDFYERRSD